MKVVCALDSFKGSVTSLEAGNAARDGVLSAIPDAIVEVIPIADGGEGTLEALMAAHGHDRIAVETTNSVHNPITIEYGIIERQGTRAAVIETARVIGIDQVTVNETLPPLASSYGLGPVVLDAIDRGVAEILVTLGGSATTDGGTGLLQALGATLRDSFGHAIATRTNPLWSFAETDFSATIELDGVSIRALSDVTNPLTGPEGAAAVFGSQKGATSQQLRRLDAQLVRWGRCLSDYSGHDVNHIPGAGAAGGLGAALIALGATMEPGFVRIAREIGLASAIQGADLVITGEGSLDAQSAYGKVPSGVARLAREAGALVVGLAGRVKEPIGVLDELFDGVYEIHDEPLPLEVAMRPDIAMHAITTAAARASRSLLRP